MLRTARAVAYLTSLVLMVVLSSCSDSDDTPTEPGGTECRTYPTAATDVTVNNVSTVRVTYSGTFEPATSRTVYTVHYDDSAGPDFNYQQITEYRSTADFVDEVKSIPPRTLSLRSTASGGVAFSVNNSYDGQRRLTGFTRSAAGETITTTYTAWDNAGRPTAGAQSNAGTISISYNDSARSQTTVIFGLGSEVATFDRNGSPETLVHDTGVGPVTTTTTIASTANVCK